MISPVKLIASPDRSKLYTSFRPVFELIPLLTFPVTGSLNPFDVTTTPTVPVLSNGN